MSRDSLQEKKETTEISARIREMRERFSISRSELAEKTGLDEHRIRDAETGKTNPSALLLKRICDNYGGIDNWLLTGEEAGEGPRTSIAETHGVYRTASNAALVREIKERLSAPKEWPNPVILADHPERIEELEGRDVYRAIPYASTPAAAGEGRVVEEALQGYVVVHERIARHPENLVAVPIEGDSMLPALPSGSIVAIDKTRTDPHTLFGRIVAARTDIGGEIAIKRLKKGRNCLILESDNPAGEHPPIVIDPESIPGAIVGAVIWAWLEFR